MKNSIILDIPNVRQVANGLCWAAALAPVITFMTGQTISQQDLAAAAGRRPADGATVDDMARALAAVARVLAQPTPPISAEAAFRCLAKGHPILLVVDVGQGFVAHCVTLRGLIPTGDWHAIVNEPNLANHHSVFVPFSRLRAAWREGLLILRRPS